MKFRGKPDNTLNIPVIFLIVLNTNIDTEAWVDCLLIVVFLHKLGF